MPKHLSEYTWNDFLDLRLDFWDEPAVLDLIAAAEDHLNNPDDEGAQHPYAEPQLTPDQAKMGGNTARARRIARGGRGLHPALRRPVARRQAHA